MREKSELVRETLSIDDETKVTTQPLKSVLLAIHSSG